jgi:2-dehydropantoate 2-reductase
MRHAVLGGGGVGGLLAGAFARSGEEVVLLLRPESLERYPGRITVESVVLGDFAVAVPAVATLDREVDAVWVATKATQLEPALRLAPAERVGDALVVPLLNGVDHVARLRGDYPRVVAAAIQVESERLPSMVVRQRSPFLRIEIAITGDVPAALRRAGIECVTRDDELSLLWGKLVFLAPIALATSALDTPVGGVRGDERFRRCCSEALAVAEAEGARIDRERVGAVLDRVPDDMRSSMQKDVEAARPPELDAIAGPIVRGGARHGIATPATEQLAALVRARAVES